MPKQDKGPKLCSEWGLNVRQNKHLKPPGCMWLDYASLARKNELEAIHEVFWLYSWDGVNISKRVYLS